MAARRHRRARKARREEQVRPSYVGRRRTLLALFGLAAAALVWRAVDQQIFEKDFLQSEAAIRHLDVVEVPAHRGRITDRHGVVLAVSTPVESVGANPRQLGGDSRTLARLGTVLNVEPEDLRRRLARYQDRQFVYLQRRVNPDRAAAVRALIREQSVRGLRLEREYRRYYPAAEVLAHVVGFTDVDDRGQEGLELAYDAALRGRAGAKRVLRDGHRQVVADVESIRMPKPGKNLALSLDQRLQYIAYRELKAAVQWHKARAASAVLLDVRSGEVLAMVNQPGYNPNKDRSNRHGRLRNRAVTDVFEPGSTMKPFVVAAALDAGLYRPDSTIDTSPGYFRVGSAEVRDSRDLGVIDLTTLLSRSSNVGAGRIALELPRESLYRQLRRLGFGESPAVGFPGEASGQLPPPARWARIDQATLAFGYGVSVSALQLAQAYAVLAADGRRRPVSLLRREQAPDGEPVFSPGTSRAVRAMLEVVVSADGTAPQAAIPGYRVAGKTGTVKKLGRDGYSDDRYLAVFAGMVPASAPRLVMAVVIDEPRRDQYYGGEVAAPVFARVMDDALRLMNVPPDALPGPTVRLAVAEDAG